MRAPIDPELKALARGRRPLATGLSPDGQVLGLVDRLLFRDADGVRQQPWHEIERGRWDEAARTLSWLDASGRNWRLELVETGRLPDLFNERVTASIACVRVLELERGSAVITARRDLADVTAALSWRVLPGPGTDPDALAAPVVAAELARLRSEYDLA